MLSIKRRIVSYRCPDFTLKPVMGTSVHAPIQSNSTYVQTFRLYIYETRLTKHPRLPIRRYQRRPQVPVSWTRYTESCPDTALLYVMDMDTSTSTVLESFPLPRSSLAHLNSTSPTIGMPDPLPQTPSSA